VHFGASFGNGALTGARNRRHARFCKIFAIKKRAVLSTENKKAQ